MWLLGRKVESIGQRPLLLRPKPIITDSWVIVPVTIKVITKLPNSEQSYKGKVKTHNYINRQNQSTTGKLWKP